MAARNEESLAVTTVGNISVNGERGSRERDRGGEIQKTRRKRSPRGMGSFLLINAPCGR
jgi:hypothetical protein